MALDATWPMTPGVGGSDLRSTTSTGAQALRPDLTTEAPPARVSRLGVGPDEAEVMAPDRRPGPHQVAHRHGRSLPVLHGTAAFLDDRDDREVGISHDPTRGVPTISSPPLWAAAQAAVVSASVASGVTTTRLAPAHGRMAPARSSTSSPVAAMTRTLRPALRAGPGQHRQPIHVPPAGDIGDGRLSLSGRSTGRPCRQGMAVRSPEQPPAGPPGRPVLARCARAFCAKLGGALRSSMTETGAT